MLSKSTLDSRPYQQRAIRETLSRLLAGESILLVAPTGSGKTVMAAQIVRRFKNVLLVAHRIEIIRQAREIGVRAMGIQEALRRGPQKVGLLIIDEAHRAAAATYQALIKKYSTAIRLGLTATPMRTDGQGLCDAFDGLVVSSSMGDLVAEGHLVPYRAFEAKDEDLKKLAAMKKRGGDYAVRELTALMNQPRLVGDVVREYVKNASGRKAVCFAVSIEHSRALENAFIAAGVRATHMDGRATAEAREGALKDLAEGEIDVLCNVNLFTEGWDCPVVSCVIMARPTASLTLYLQSVGRGMRPDRSSGKADLVILDHAGNIERHLPPDHPRDWSLESDKQRSRREAQIAELNRLYALGFSSIEAELEEKRKTRRITLSAGETTRLLARNYGAFARLSPLLRIFGIVPTKGVRQFARYLRSDVEKAIKEIASTVTAKQASRSLGYPEGVLIRVMPEVPWAKSRGRRRYYIEDINRELQKRSDLGYTTAEVMGLLGNKSDNFRRLWKSGVSKEKTKTPGKKGDVNRYDRRQVDNYVSILKSSVACKELREMLGVSRGGLTKILLRYGIKPNITGLYSQCDIGELVVIRGKKKHSNGLCRAHSL